MRLITLDRINQLKENKYNYRLSLADGINQYCSGIKIDTLSMSKRKQAKKKKKNTVCLHMAFSYKALIVPKQWTKLP